MFFSRLCQLKFVKRSLLPYLLNYVSKCYKNEEEPLINGMKYIGIALSFFGRLIKDI
jgi:hypothetical protein